MPRVRSISLMVNLPLNVLADPTPAAHQIFGAVFAISEYGFPFVPVKLAPRRRQATCCHFTTRGPVMGPRNPIPAIGLPALESELPFDVSHHGTKMLPDVSNIEEVQCTLSKLMLGDHDVLRFWRAICHEHEARRPVAGASVVTCGQTFVSCLIEPAGPYVLWRLPGVSMPT